MICFLSRSWRETHSPKQVFLDQDGLVDDTVGNTLSKAMSWIGLVSASWFNALLYLVMNYIFFFRLIISPTDKGTVFYPVGLAPDLRNTLMHQNSLSWQLGWTLETVNLQRQTGCRQAWVIGLSSYLVCTDHHDGRAILYLLFTQCNLQIDCSSLKSFLIKY